MFAQCHFSHMQALVPKLEGVVSQRAQLINVAEQVAALQTAFNMLSHGNRCERPSPHVCTPYLTPLLSIALHTSCVHDAHEGETGAAPA